jgi:hypothetical protein
LVVAEGDGLFGGMFLGAAGGAFGLAFGGLFRYHTADSAKAKDIWTAADWIGHYGSGLVGFALLAVVIAAPVGWLSGHLLGRRRMATMAPLVGPGAMAAATGLVALATPGVQILDSGEAADLVFQLLGLGLLAGLAIGVAAWVRRQPPRHPPRAGVSTAGPGRGPQ